MSKDIGNRKEDAEKGRPVDRGTYPIGAGVCIPPDKAPPVQLSKSLKRHQTGQICLSRSPRLCTNLVPRLRSYPPPSRTYLSKDGLPRAALPDALASANTKGFHIFSLSVNFTKLYEI